MEGYLMKQTWSFQRWRRRYFRLQGTRLSYAKDDKVSRYIWTLKYLILGFQGSWHASRTGDIYDLYLKHSTIGGKKRVESFPREGDERGMGEGPILWNSHLSGGLE